LAWAKTSQPLSLRQLNFTMLRVPTLVIHRSANDFALKQRYYPKRSIFNENNLLMQ
jgi:hypothetical protein